MSQSLQFKRPVKIGDEAVAEVVVEELMEEKGRVNLACTVKVNDKVVLEGEALIMVPKRPE